MHNGGRSGLNTQIYEEATEWFVECRTGDLEEAARREFDSWLRKSPEHVAAYLEIAAIWKEGNSLDLADKRHVETLLREAGDDTGVLVALTRGGRSSWGIHSASSAAGEAEQRDVSAAAPEGNRSASSLHRAREPSKSVGSARRWRVAAALCAFAGASAFAWFQLFAFTTYTTDIGEQRSVLLEDGSTLELNSRSKVRVFFSAHQRNITLVAGQALFHVAKDPRRPFIVNSDGTRVRAVGTQFDVYQKGAGTIVTVVEGRVAVVPGAIVPDYGGSGGASSAHLANADNSVAQQTGMDALFPKSGPGAVLVSAGEQLIVRGASVQRTTDVDVAEVTAWEHHQLVFDSASLSDVVQEFNRYNRRPLVVDRPDLDTFHLSGVFSSSDPASLIQFLRDRYGLQIIETPDSIRIE